jgi:hypothetical protein
LRFLVILPSLTRLIGDSSLVVFLVDLVIVGRDCGSGEICAASNGVVTTLFSATFVDAETRFDRRTGDIAEVNESDNVNFVEFFLQNDCKP